jgi:3-oxoadipate enol-lactonase
MIVRMPREHRISVNGRATRYLEAGTGRPLVLLHAFPFAADMWQFQVDHVPDGWRFIAPDLRGFGASPYTHAPVAGGVRPSVGTDANASAHMDDYAGDVLALLDTLGIETAVIGGLSMGGYVTFALFRQAPARFEGMILADTKAQPDTPEGQAGRRAMLELLRASGVSAVAGTLITKLVGETTQRERPQVVADVRRLMEANQPDAIDAALHALMTRPDSTADLRHISGPALIIVGQEDVVTPAADAELLACSIPGAELVVLPRAGHLSNLEAPEGFSSALTRFLSRAF